MRDEFRFLFWDKKRREVWKSIVYGVYMISFYGFFSLFFRFIYIFMISFNYLVDFKRNDIYFIEFLVYLY